MNYEVRVLRSASRELERLSQSLYERIYGRIQSLRDNPRPRGVRKLRVREQYRIRVGDYRVLYTIDDAAAVVAVLSIEHRREAYR